MHLLGQFAAQRRRGFVDGEAALDVQFVQCHVARGGAPLLGGECSHLDRSFGNSRGVRRIEGAKLFFPEEFPDVIAEEARRLCGV